MLKKNILQLVVTSIFGFAFLVNFLFLGYISYYEIGGYRDINNDIKLQFENSVTDWDSVNYNDLCFSLEPKGFLEVYHTLKYFSILVTIISVIIATSFLVLDGRGLPKKIRSRIVVFLIALVIFSSTLFLYEADYDFVLPCMNSSFYQANEVSI